MKITPIWKSPSKTMATDPKTGEQVPDENVAAEEKVSHRQKMLDAIAETRAQELGEGGDDAENEGAQGEAGAEAAAEAAGDEGGDEGEGEDAAGEGEEGDGAEAAAEADPLVEIEVDGQKQQIRLSRLRKSFEIEQQAVARINEATAVLNARRPAAEEPKETPAPDLPVSDQELEEVARSLAYDDPAEGAKKLKDVVKKLRQPSGEPLDVNAIQQNVSRQVYRQVEFDRAVADFGANYKDILADSKLAALAGADANAVLQQEMEKEQRGQRRKPYSEILMEAGERTRQWAKSVGIDLKAPGASTDDPPDQKANEAVVDLAEERQQRKQSATGKQPQPRTIRQRRTTHQAEAPTVAPSEIERSRSAISEIMKARGQIR